MDPFWSIYKKTVDSVQNFGALVTPAVMADFAAVLLTGMTLYIGYEYFFFYLRRKRTEVTFIRKDPNFIYNTKECPICFENFSMPVIRTPCGHAYCMTCLLSYFKTNCLIWKCVCPLCRGFVNDFTVLEGLGEPSKLTMKQIAKTHSLLAKMVKQQNKDLILSKPWPFIKGLVMASPFFIVFCMVKYAMSGKFRNVPLDQQDNTLASSQMIY